MADYDKKESPIRYCHPRSKLESQPNVLLNIGTSPDDLPLVLEIRRGIDIISGILIQLGYDDETKLPPKVKASLKQLEEDVREDSCDRGIETVVSPNGKTENMYCSDHPIAQILGHTILSRLLGDSSPALAYTAPPGAGSARFSGSARKTSTTYCANLDAGGHDAKKATKELRWGTEENLSVFVFLFFSLSYSGDL